MLSALMRLVAAGALGYLLAAGGVAIIVAILARFQSMVVSEAALAAAIAGIPLWAAATTLFWYALRRPGPPSATERKRGAQFALHHILGLASGGLIFIVFLTGTLSLFDREFDRWSMAELRRDAPTSTSLDGIAALAEAIMPDAERWSMTLPTERSPLAVLRLTPKSGETVVVRVDAMSGRRIETADPLLGTGFLLPLHSYLNLSNSQLGYWVAGLAAIAWLVMTICGVLTHRRLFADFFTLRLKSGGAAIDRDLHVLLGGVGLVFNTIVTLTGALMLASILFSLPLSVHFGGDVGGLEESLSGKCGRSASGLPGHHSSLDAIIAKATIWWAGERPHLVAVDHPGDARATVEALHGRERVVSVKRERLCFDAASGDLISRFPSAGPVQDLEQGAMGIHMVQYDNWGLRWLHFLSGLAGCVLVATGLRHWANGSSPELHVRRRALADALIWGPVAGLALALFGGRLLPADVANWGPSMSLPFWAGSVSCLLVAGARPTFAGIWSSSLIAGAAILAVVLNAVQSKGGLLAPGARLDLATAGIDIALLMIGFAAVLNVVRSRTRVVLA